MKTCNLHYFDVLPGLGKVLLFRSGGLLLEDGRLIPYSDVVGGNVVSVRRLTYGVILTYFNK